jgi:hypothetical protein
MNPIDLFTLIERLRYGWSGAQTFLAIWAPIAPIPNLIAPFLAIASVISVALLAGVAVAALSTLLIALAALHVIITQVLGLSIEIAV